MSEAVDTIDRKLHAKKSFKNELQSVFDVIKSSVGLSKEDFVKNKVRLEPVWREVDETTKEYINAITDNDDNDNLGEDANIYLELIEKQWEQFLSLEAEIKKKLLDIDKKTLAK